MINFKLTRQTLLVPLVFLVMVVFGFLENLKGPLIPSIRGDYAVNYSNIGLMLFISALGYLVAVLLGGIAGDKFGQKNVLVAGFMLIMLALGGIGLSNSFVMLVFLLFVMNLGLGCFEIGANSLGAKIFVKNSAMMMNLLHLFYGVGSAISPKFAGWLLVNNIPWNYVYLYSVVLVAAVFVILLISTPPKPREEQKSEHVPIKKIASDKKVWLFVALLGFCVAAELGTANWLVNFLHVARAMDQSTSASYLSLFFITFTTGRLVGGVIAEKLGYMRTLRYFTLGAILLFAGGLTLGVHGAFMFSLVGFFVSIMFPTVMAIIMKEFPVGTGAIMGFIITGSGAINMIANWAIGTATDYLGVYFGFAFILIYLGLVIAFLGLLQPVISYQQFRATTEIRTTS